MRVDNFVAIVATDEKIIIFYLVTVVGEITAYTDGPIAYCTSNNCTENEIKFR